MNKHMLVISVILLTGFRWFELMAQDWQWQNPLPQGNRIRSIDAVDKDHVWFGTSAGVVLHTSDGGKSWQIQQTPSSAWLGGIDFVDTQYGWVVGVEEEGGANSALLHTYDGGETWVRQEFPEGISYISGLDAVEFIDRNRGWAVGSRILYTTNGGATWENRSGGIHRDLRDLSVIDSMRVWVVGEYTLAHTEDGGETWHKDTTELGSRTFNEVLFVDADHGWILTTSHTGELYKTTDGGSSWTLSNGEITDNIYHMFFLSPDSGWVMTVGGVYWTTDGGTTWDKISDEPIIKFLFLDGSAGWGSGSFSSYTTADIFRTTDGGKNWENFTTSVTSLEKGVGLGGVDFVDSETGWVVGTPGGIILGTTDGGENWIRQESGVNAGFADVKFLNKRLGWAVGTSATIIQTKDGGRNWQTQRHTTGSDTIYHAVAFVDSLKGWIVGESYGGGVILHTTDGGETWIDQTPGDTQLLFDITFVNEYEGWMAGYSYNWGAIYHTTDGGENWVVQLEDQPHRLKDITFVNRDDGWASGEDWIIRTTDGGQNWDIVIEGEGIFPLGIFFIDAERGWTCGVGGTLYYTTDGGDSWQRQLSLTTMSLSAMDFVDLNTGWVVGDMGVILHTSTGGMTGVQPEQDKNPIPLTFRLYPNYPNPFNSRTKIHFEIEEPTADVRLIIYDIGGRKVSVLIDKTFKAGSYEVNWSGTNESGLPCHTGIYLCSLVVDGEGEAIKMLLLR